MVQEEALQNLKSIFFTQLVYIFRYRMFYLLNKKLSFEVDVTACGCGMNSALYFISMESDGGQASSGYTGATYGTGYCDAQPPQPGRPSCDELDNWEANSLTNAYTTHPCLNGQYDPYGCGFNTYARGEKNFYGRGAGCGQVVGRLWAAPKSSRSSPDSSPSTELTTEISRRFSASAASRMAALSSSRHSTVLMACLTPIAANPTHKVESPTACRNE
jgi:hypothetical protein